MQRAGGAGGSAGPGIWISAAEQTGEPRGPGPIPEVRTPSQHCRVHSRARVWQVTDMEPVTRTRTRIRARAGGGEEARGHCGTDSAALSPAHMCYYCVRAGIASLGTLLHLAHPVRPAAAPPVSFTSHLTSVKTPETPIHQWSAVNKPQLLSRLKHANLFINSIFLHYGDY